jgi:hypothetical protein
MHSNQIPNEKKPAPYRFNYSTELKEVVFAYEDSALAKGGHSEGKTKKVASSEGWEVGGGELRRGSFDMSG